MLLRCPVCPRAYHVKDAELQGGRIVVCPQCDAQWFVDPVHRRSPAGSVAAKAASPVFQRPHALASSVSFATGLIAAFAVAITIIAEREPIVRLAPRTQALFAAVGMPVNTRGLAFARIGVTDVDASRTDAAPDRAISGVIRNVASRRVRLPRLAFEIRDAAGQSLVSWSEKAPARSLDVGAVMAFTSAPHAIPEEARTLLVHFETDDEALRDGRT